MSGVTCACVSRYAASVLAFLFCLSLLSAFSVQRMLRLTRVRTSVKMARIRIAKNRRIDRGGIHLAKRCVSSHSNRAGKWASKSFNSFLFLFKIRINQRTPNSADRTRNLDRHIYSRDIYFRTCRDFAE